MSFDVTILGSSAALPTSGRYPPAHLLTVDERFFLIDCGEGTQIQLRRFGMNPARIHHIFISHLHGDHVFGLFGLVSSLAMMGRNVPLHLYGPDMLRNFMEQYLAFFGPLPYRLQFHTPAERIRTFLYEDDKITVSALPLKHRTETFGFVFREKKRLLNLKKEKIEQYGLGIADRVKVKQGEDFVDKNGRVIPNRDLTLPPYRSRSYAYISDTVYDPTLAERMGKVDLLFHEATFSNRDSKLAGETLHSTAGQAATVARNAAVGRLLIGHFSSRYRDHGELVEEARHVFERTEGVSDGEVYSVPRARESRE